MKTGKLPNDVLKRLILDKIKHKRKEVLVGPEVGIDCCCIDFKDNICVMSTDPITGTVNEVGRLAVHVSCNDIAASGSEPLGIMVTLLAPPDSTEDEIERIMKQLTDTASKLNVDILGGHTEVTPAVNQYVIIGTCVGKVLKEKMVTSSGANAGEEIVLTKSAGLEGTAVIAYEKEDELIKNFGYDLVSKAKKYIDDISVVKEGMIAGSFGVSAMHDVTEGGVLGAVWEIAEASNIGVKIFKDSIPLKKETSKISNYFGIDALKLISSGCMLIISKEGKKLTKILRKNNVEATVIGETTKAKQKIMIKNEETTVIEQPDSDELYKVV